MSSNHGKASSSSSSSRPSSSQSTSSQAFPTTAAAAAAAPTTTCSLADLLAARGGARASRKADLVLGLVVLTQVAVQAYYGALVYNKVITSFSPKLRSLANTLHPETRFPNGRKWLLGGMMVNGVLGSALGVLLLLQAALRTRWYAHALCLWAGHHLVFAVGQVLGVPQMGAAENKLHWGVAKWAAVSLVLPLLALTRLASLPRHGPQQGQQPGGDLLSLAPLLAPAGRHKPGKGRRLWAFLCSAILTLALLALLAQVATSYSIIHRIPSKWGKRQYHLLPVTWHKPVVHNVISSDVLALFAVMACVASLAPVWNARQTTGRLAQLWAAVLGASMCYYGVELWGCYKFVRAPRKKITSPTFILVTGIGLLVPLLFAVWAYRRNASIYQRIVTSLSQQTKDQKKKND